MNEEEEGKKHTHTQTHLSLIDEIVLVWLTWKNIRFSVRNFFVDVMHHFNWCFLKSTKSIEPFQPNNHFQCETIHAKCFPINFYFWGHFKGFFRNGQFLCRNCPHTRKREHLPGERFMFMSLVNAWWRFTQVGEWNWPKFEVHFFLRLVIKFFGWICFRLRNEYVCMWIIFTTT